MGSSPLARGLRDPTEIAAAPTGIIPARAGFTSGRVTSSRNWQDHPRSRGVYLQAGSARITGEGSSPLARGLRRRRGGRAAADRIIPARAGFTRAPPSESGWGSDHPRSRGVYSQKARRAARAHGSSPLARGLRGDVVSWEGVAGIIPARAGFTSGRVTSSRNWQDHPRSRGVYTCGSLESQRRATLPDRVCLHCRPSARSAELR